MQPHTIVIGAGVAGLVTARELAFRGHRVTVLESRDRLGGRAWAREHWGRSLEIGGTWLHWVQPHIWAEVVRYDLEVTRGPALEDAYWLERSEPGGPTRVRTGTGPELLRLIDRGMTELLAPTREALPRPDRPVAGPVLRDADAEILADRLAALDIPEEERLANEAAWVGHVNCDPAEASFSAALRWTAATAGSWHLMHEASATYRLAAGTGALIGALAADAVTAGAEIRTSTRVRSVTDDPATSTVTVATGGGETLTADHVVLTVPLNVVADIDVTPAPADRVLEVSREQAACRGVKVWIRVKGPITPFYAYSSAEHPLSVLRSEYVGDPVGQEQGDTVIVGFGADHTRLDPNDSAAVAEALKVWRDDLEVLDSTGHDWTADADSKETWLIQKPGQFTASHDLYRAPVAAGRIRYAGADTGTVWTGFLDGAVESGLRVSREIIDMNRGTQ